MGIVLIFLALAAVVLILGAGLYTLWHGGQLAKDWSNRLMRYRVIAQFIAICIVLLVAYVTAKH
ncbi:MAG: twin transmembrane helix small protein [Rhizomicrobium sp.]|jgi:hypothetical protein